MKANPKLSRASKMPCKSWSLPAWKTCPGAKDEENVAVEACAHCYARQGHYRFGSVKALREHNLKDWKSDDWTDAMVYAIRHDKYFRWFDSGDVYCVELAQKIKEVVQRTPNTKHWLPTRSYKIADIAKKLEEISKLSNAVVRYSSDSVRGKVLGKFHNSTIIQKATDFTKNSPGILCRAFERAGKCGKCRACWSKHVPTVSYALHGNRIKEPKVLEV